jgi:sulfur carrier protein ThiS
MVIDMGNRKSSYASQNIFKDKYIVIGSMPVTQRGGMFVRITLFTKLVSYIPGVHPGALFIYEISHGSTISDLMMHLRVPEREVSMVFVNGLHRPGEYQLKNDDNVSVFPLVGG